MILTPSSSSLPNSSQYSMWLNKVSRVWAVPGRVVMLCGAHTTLSPFPPGTALCFSCFLLNYDFFSLSKSLHYDTFMLCPSLFIQCPRFHLHHQFIQPFIPSCWAGFHQEDPPLVTHASNPRFLIPEFTLIFLWFYGSWLV